MNDILRQGCSAVAFGMLAAVTGCGTSEFLPAEGVVTLNGQPLANATVVFQAPNRPLATARTDADGWYFVETGSIGGIKPGEYSVTVAAYEKANNSGDRAPRLSTPKKYLQPESSGLRAIIDQETNRSLDFDLRAN